MGDVNRARLGLATFLLVLVACSAPRWRPADPDDPDAEVCCTGTIVAMRTEPDGVVGIDLRPRPASAHLLATGRSVLPCELAPDRREPFEPLLSRLRVGQEVEICGYLVLDDARDGLRLIRTITSIDAYPED